MASLRQIASLGLLAAAAGLLAAALFRPTTPPLPDARRAQWSALPAPRQNAYVRRYQAIAGRSDAGDVLAQARHFAALEPEHQARLRWLQDFLQKRLDELPAPRRLALLALHERARAEALYHLIKSDSPQMLEEVRLHLAGGS